MKKNFKKTYVAQPSGDTTTWQEDLNELSKYLREGKPSPWTMEDWEDVD